MNQYFLGLSTSGHDPALALVDPQGKVVFAEATERFVQQKRAWGVAPDHPDHLRSFIPKHVEKGASVKVTRSWSRPKQELPMDISGGYMFDNKDIKWLLSLQGKAFNDAGVNLEQYLGEQSVEETDNFDHHLCHAVNACYSTPFDSGMCLVIDGEGEVGAASLYRLENRELKRIWRSWGPGSLGSYYGWLTKACGFDWRVGEEWKVMGLAAYGTPNQALVEALKKSIRIDKGRPYLPEMEVLKEVLEKAAPFNRLPGDYIMKAANLAASGQAAYAFFVDEMIRHCEGYGYTNLVLSGGCALNSSYNGSIAHRFAFEQVHVPSAPADDGNALGAALLGWMKANNTNRIPESDGSPYLGTDTATTLNERKQYAFNNYGNFSRIKDCGGNSAAELAKVMSAGKIVGVMRGRAEFGPRALGNRSIMADPRRADCKEYINQRVKGREPYRPFAPMVPEERTGEFFHHSQASPYMSFTLPWKEAFLSQVPGVVHEDGTGRLQTVNATMNPWANDLLHAFEKNSDLPILLNTSFNVMGKPILHSVEDAMAILMTTGLDAVLLDELLIEK